MSKNIRKIQGLWIWALFSCLTILKWVNSAKHPYGFNSNSNLKHICKWLCMWLLLNGIVHTLWPRTSPFQYWSCVWCIANKFIPCLIVCSIDVQPEPEATPFVEDPDIEPRQQGKQTPLIMSIKSQFPLSLAYACLGDHLVSILPHSWTHIRCMTYHLVTVVSKPQSWLT